MFIVFNHTEDDNQFKIASSFLHKSFDFLNFFALNENLQIRGNVLNILIQLKGNL